MIDIDKLIKVWSGEKYRNCMLPGVGATTCGEVAAALASALIEEGNAKHRSEMIEYHVSVDARSRINL